MEENVIDLRDVFETIKKSWKIIAIFALVGTIMASILSFFIIKPEYQTTTKLFIGKEQGSNADYNNSDIQMYQNLLKTYEQVIKTKDLVETAIKKSGADVNASEVLSNLTVESIQSTQIMQIKYMSKNPEESLAVLDAVKNEFISKSKQLVANGNIQVVEEPVFPQSPASPNKKRNIAIGFILGAVLGTGLVLLKELLDNTYKNKEQLEREFDIPVIGVIPNLNCDIE